MKNKADNSKISADYKIWKQEMPLPKRLLYILLSYITFVLVILLMCITLIPWSDNKIRALTAILFLYVMPPLISRFLLWIFPIRLGLIKITSNDFIKWWALLNVQMIFCRLPLLEELLRMIPGIYGPWLRLWGAKIGRLTYWAPGLKILDRSFLNIGDDVIFGVNVTLNPHIMFIDDNGELVLALDNITIGSRTTIGGYSNLSAGNVIYPDQTTRAVLNLPPFTKWRNGKRLKD